MIESKTVITPTRPIHYNDDEEGPMFMISDRPKAIKDEKGSPWAMKDDERDLYL